MEQKSIVSRIDFSVAGDVIVVNKIDDQTIPGRAIVTNSRQHPKSELDKMIAWCEANGFHVRRFLPLGARAWFGALPRPVRRRGQTQRKRSELERYPVEGLQLQALDLVYDC